MRNRKPEMIIVNVMVDDFPNVSTYPRIKQVLVQSAKAVVKAEKKLEDHQMIDTRYILDSFSMKGPGTRDPNSVIINGKVEVYYQKI